jgi:hypothetical protein
MARRFRLEDLPPPLEHAVQAVLCRLLAVEIAPPGRLSAAGVCWICIDHAQIIPRSMQDRGVIPGVPDMLIMFRGKHFWIEIKRDGPMALLSLEQQALIPVLIGAGDRVGLVRNAEELLALLDGWGIPRANRTTLGGVARHSRAKRGNGNERRSGERGAQDSDRSQ